MNRNSIFVPLIVCFLLFTTIHTNAQKIKIACVGNSITYGTLMANREKNSYPAQLQNMLGGGYEIGNFGVSGRTLLRKGNHTYWKTDEYKKALTSAPHIVFIKLGSNDSKAINRPYYDEFEKDYKDLIDSFRLLPTHPRVVLLLPIPSFHEDSMYIYDAVIKQQIIPRIKKVAYETGCELLDLYSVFINQPGLLPDKIHPSSIGATVIARRLYEVIKLNEKKSFDIFSKIKKEKKLSSFHGFECADFTFNNRSCKIVKPKKTVAGLPWVWRARFWGHQPQTDIALLERGFHIVYCDVAELFGNKEAVDLWNKFYGYMQQCGLAKKPAMEGMSRGGVYVYNWALANPGKVACIYADAPVLDLRSWPGGKKDAGGKEPWEAFKKGYNLTEEQALQFSNNPLDNATKIARLGFPMLHVVGDADDVVPVEENTNPFEQKIKAAGGDITVIHKPGVNHHPHSLQNPAPIVDFILRATGQKINFAAIAAPGSEYRSGAGWTEGKDWWAQHQNIDSLLEVQKGLDIIFLGNSITQGTGGHRTWVTHKPGFTFFDSVFSGYKWESAGISGDRTQNVLWRLEHGNYKLAKPKVLVITIGVNNFVEEDSPEEIAAGIFAIADYAVKNIPSTKIIVTGPLPTGLQKDTDRRKKYERIHQLLAKRKTKQYIYLPFTTAFVQTDGSLSTSDYSTDAIHLASNGYRKWAIALQPVITGLLNRK